MLGVAVVTAAAAAAVAATTGAGAPKPQPIVYAARPAEGEHEFGLYVLDKVGGSSRRIAAAGTPAEEPAWSPDRRRIAYAGKAGIYVIGANGTGRKLVVPTAGAKGPDWSPDGRRLVFSAPVGNVDELFVANADGSAPRKLTSEPPAGHAFDPAWSPNGRRIVYSRFVVLAPAGQLGLFVVPAAGGAAKRLTRGEDSGPSWSPDGKTILFSRGVDEETDEIFAMNANGTRVRRLTNGIVDLSPSWSPDGTRFVYTRDLQLAVAARDGKSPRNVTTAARQAVDPDW
jgi:TolB protein